MPDSAILARPRFRVAQRFATLVVVVISCVLALAIWSTPAHAALITDATYTAATAAPLNCGLLGQSDENGVFYSTCGAKIVRWDKDGTKLPDLAIPAGLKRNPADVAPSPDGLYLYVTQDADTPRRLNRQPNGTYALDATWALKKLSVWNVQFTPMGRSLATDGRGDIYLSNGSFTTESQRSVAKFQPDGTFVSAFGDWGKEPGNWITNQDIAVSRDGRRVFVGENCGVNCIYGTKGYDASRVTRYDFTPGGTYRFSRVLTTTGPTGGKAFPDCDIAGAAHSAYSVAMDFWDNVYVTSTTCGRIQMFSTNPLDASKDKFVRSVARWDDQTAKNHYIASDWAGRLRAYQWNRVFTPKTPKLPTLPLPALAPLPTPDLVAPVLVNLTMPATTTTQAVQVKTVATDDRVVAEMQLAREDGEWGPWQPYAPQVTYQLSDGLGTKGVYVRVRDMAGNESNAVYRTIGFVEAVAGDNQPPPVADAADPVLSAFAIPALTPTNDIQVVLTATDDTGVRTARFANEDGNWGPWRAFEMTTTWTLSPGPGMKAVFAQVRDGAGRESGVLSARTQVAPDAPAPPPPGEAPVAPDTVAPVLASFTIPAETTARTVAAALVATDNVAVAQVRFANEDGNWTGWQKFGAKVNWTLTDGFGAKLVYAQVRDAVGNESLVLQARSSFVRTAAGPVDTADPALTLIELPAESRGANATVRLAATDDIGVTQVRFANEDGNWGPWVAYATDVPHTLTAGNTMKVVYAQVRDAAGRESNVLFARTLVVA